MAFPAKKFYLCNNGDIKRVLQNFIDCGFFFRRQSTGKIIDEYIGITEVFRS